MIKITVKLKNDFDSTYDEVEITKEELMQYACKKAVERYNEGYWTMTEASDEMAIQVK